MLVDISSSVVPFSSCLLSFQKSGSSLMSQLFASGGQRIGASASTISLPMHIQCWFPLGLTGLIFLQSKGISILQHHSSKESIVRCSSLLYGPTLTSPYDFWKNHNFDYMDICWQSDVSAFNMLFRFVIAFLPRSKCLLISWLQSPSSVILEPKKRKSLTVSTFPPSICHEVMGSDVMILVFWMLSIKSVFSLLFHHHQEALLLHYNKIDRGNWVHIQVDMRILW